MNLLLSDLNISLAAHKIIKGVSLDVSHKSFVGLLGPNGSGKSTLLRAVYRMIKPDSGVILLDGKNPDTLGHKALAQKMAVVGQFHKINFELTVEEIVLMGRTPHLKMLQKESMADREIMRDALEKVGMKSYAKRSFSSLSGGEQQRIILARAIAQKPKLLILDEPTNHLDITYQLQILDIIKSLRINVLAALHDMTLAAQYCDTVYILNNGTVDSHGPPRQVITPDMVKRVYHVNCDIRDNPATGTIAISYYHSK